MTKTPAIQGRWIKLPTGVAHYFKPWLVVDKVPANGDQHQLQALCMMWRTPKQTADGTDTKHCIRCLRKVKPDVDSI